MDEFEPTIQDYLIRLQDSDPEVRQNTAWVLGRLRNADVIQSLLYALQDTEAIVRIRVVEALGNFQDERIPPALIQSLQDVNEDVRIQAIRSLANLKETQTIEHFINALNDSSPKIRNYAIQALGSMCVEQAVDLIINIFLTDDDDAVRYQANQSIVQIGGEHAQTRLLSSLSTISDVNMLISIIEILAKIGTADAILPLQELERHLDEGIRETAVWAIEVLQKRNI